MVNQIYTAMEIQIEIDYEKLADKVASRLREFATPRPVGKEIRGIRALAEYLGCSIVTAQKLKNDGKIPYSTIGNRVVFNSIELDKFLGRK